jgi:glycerate 2-kinase
VRIIVAMDKFAGTLTAPEAARAVAEGWHRTAPDDEVVCVPMADGGPGFLDALAMAWEDGRAGDGGGGATADGGGRVGHPRTDPDGEAAAGAADVAQVPVDEELATVTGPLGDQVTARYLVHRAATGDAAPVTTAYIEVAEACGLHLIPPAERKALIAGTFGVGELIDAAITRGATRIVIGLGGTCSTDGGAGMLAALGAEPADVLRGGGGALTALESVDLSAAQARLEGIELVIASDVDNPLLGLRGASAVFGPQKGASADDVQRLDAALTRFAELVGAIGLAPGAVRRTLDAPGAGAGGGLGYGLMQLGGRRVPGIGTVIEETGLADLVASADLVITGEGRFDHSSLGGKVPTGVAEAAQRSGRPCVVLAGLVEVGKRELANAGFAAGYEVAEQAGSAAEAMARPAFHLAALAERVARSWSHA